MARIERLTVADLATTPVADLLDSGGLFGALCAMPEVEATPAELRGAADAWCWLQGVSRADAEAWEAAREEAMTDSELFSALHHSVIEFEQWFRLSDWDCWGKGDKLPPDQDPTEDWGSGVLDQARALAKRVGRSLALQVSVVQAVASTEAARGV